MVDIIEGYETEEQQVEAIKGWWNENGNTLIIGAVLGLAALWGWRYYNDSVVQAKEEQSQAYAKMLSDFESKGFESGAPDVQAFINESSKSNYSVLASFLLAKESIEHENYPLAADQLLQAQKQNSYEPFDPIINIRLARVQVELQQFDKALKTLSKITDASFLSKANQVKGSIFLKQGKADDARVAFETAISLSKNGVDPILQLQLDDLATAENMVEAPVLDTPKNIESK